MINLVENNIVAQTKGMTPVVRNSGHIQVEKRLKYILKLDNLYLW